jgi:hypothetical protein
MELLDEIDGSPSTRTLPKPFAEPGNRIEMTTKNVIELKRAVFIKSPPLQKIMWSN